MSALDDVLDAASSCEHCYEQEEKAREELELLRDAAFERARDILEKGQVGTTQYVPERVTRILRTDPERAREMGLGWAL